MTTLLRISQIEIPEGQSTILHDINWQKFESILEQNFVTVYQILVVIRK